MSGLAEVRAKVAPMTKEEYDKAFMALLEPILASDTTISRGQLLEDANLGEAKDGTKISHLKRFLGENTNYIGVVEGVIPEAPAMIEVVEAKLGSGINDSNVVEANKICTQIVDRITRPVYEAFLRQTLENKITGNTVAVSLEDLLEFLVEDCQPFMRGIGNGLASVAGSLNEHLLMKCVEAEGLTRMQDFEKTGTKSNADIVVFAPTQSTQSLGVEVKSLHARERLLRGLQDIEGPKVGAGFFVDPSEFNEARTKTLLQTNAAAIYLPSETLAKVSDGAKSLTTSNHPAIGSRFYRPLETFGSDMSHFRMHGNLPTA